MVELGTRRLDPRAVTSKIEGVRSDIVSALQADVDHFRSQTFEALHLNPGLAVTLSLQAIQGGANQIVFLAEVEGVSFIIKGGLELDDSWYSFTKTEFEALQRGASLLSGCVVAPMTLACIDGRSMYSQRYLGDPWMEANPIRCRDLLYLNALSLGRISEGLPITPDHTEAVLSQSLCLITEIFLRSARHCLYIPSLGAGDILVSSSDFSIHCVGITYVFEGELELSFILSQLGFGNLSGEISDDLFPQVINFLGGARMLGFVAGESLTHLGHRQALVRGIKEGYDKVFGLRAHQQTGAHIMTALS